MHFILNHHAVNLPESKVFLLDWLRKHAIYSVKDVCREGECGACQVLVGRKNTAGEVHYRTYNSCLLPLSEVNHCHIITTEGLHGTENPSGAPDESALTPVQQALVTAGAIQCGYCTSGFVMALTGWLINEPSPSHENALDWLSGNLCRCTGYMGMRRAIASLIEACPPLATGESAWERALRWGVVPARFADIAAHLAIPEHNENVTQKKTAANSHSVHVGGATDLAVEQPALWFDAAVDVRRYPARQDIVVENGCLWLGGGTDIESLRQSPLVRHHLPALSDALACFASRPIRHQATVGGNIAHASPVADLSVMLMALQATLTLRNPQARSRTVAIEQVFIELKRTCLEPEEWIDQVAVPLPAPGQQTLFHFEKISKRPHQDIAAVSVALAITLNEHRIVAAGLAVGGVAPTPLALTALASTLVNQPMSRQAFITLALHARLTVSPLSDQRGSRDYRLLLVERLTLACADALIGNVNSNADTLERG